MKLRITLGMALFSACALYASPGPYQMEKLGHGLIVVRPETGKAYIGWRLLGTDPAEIAFNVYRQTGDAAPVKLNVAPIANATSFTDTTADFAQRNTYTVRPVAGGAEQAAGAPFALAANAPVGQFLSVPVQAPPPGECPDASNYTFSANDASVADLDGDGEYEIILKWEPSNSKRPPQTGYTGPHILDAYKLDGTRLWRIDLGPNVRAGAAFTQFMIYDFDGDGRAELMCKTGDGTIDGEGKPVGDPKADWRQSERQPAATWGKILRGPEYITVFDGLTGKALASKEYIPTRYPTDGWGGVGGNGGNDNTGNRVDHFSAGVAYLDGVRPSGVFVRGWYGRTVVAAWDWRDGQLMSRWVFDSAKPGLEKYSGQGNHQLTVGDFDGDGKHEVCVGAMTVDDNGEGLYSTGLRHGDALHAGDLIPARTGLEIFGIHESEGPTLELNSPGAALFDAKTGEILWSNSNGVDVARGIAADIDPNFPGAECWGSPGGTRRGDTGEVIYSETPNSVNFAVWWDGDLLRELENGNTISKWDWENRATNRLLTAEGCVANNGTKSTPCLSGDILGDWREEVIWRTSDNTALRIYTTVAPTEHRLPTLMHDPQYRLAIAWQNVAYNQPPHPSYAIGPGMKPPPQPNPAITAVEPKPRTSVR